MNTRLKHLVRRAIVESAHGDEPSMRVIRKEVNRSDIGSLKDALSVLELPIKRGDAIVSRSASRMSRIIERRIDEVISDIKYDRGLSKERKKHISDFVDYAIDKLSINDPPEIEISDDKDEVKQNRSLGYMVRDARIWVYSGERFLPDILRTLGHELVHWKQQEEGRLGPDAGKDGSPEENEANSMAAVMMRDYGRRFPEIFD